MKPQKPPTSEYIQAMFDHLARRYDLFNHLTSMGLAIKWRRETLRPAREGMRVLDVGCGTGDLALLAVRKVGPSGEVTGLDFSENMLAFARERLKVSGPNGDHRLKFVLKRAEELPIEEKPYDLVVSGFVLRNLYENIDAILFGIYKSLKTGGIISFLDITEPRSRFIRALWKFYMNSMVVFYGKILFGKNYPAFYLTESAARFLKADEFTEKLKAVGFKQVKARPFMLGTVTLYQAVK